MVNFSLRSSTPLENIKQAIQDYLSLSKKYDGGWNCMVDAAGRSFVAHKEKKYIYKAIVERINSTHVNPFPIHCSRALWRLLSLRKNSPMAMTRSQAEAFTEEVIKIMERESLVKNYKQSFFQAARLFTFLLRFRIVDRDFLDPGNEVDNELFDRTIKCLRAAENYFSNNHIPGSGRAKEILIGIEKFMRYEGSNEILTWLDRQAGGD